MKLFDAERPLINHQPSYGAPPLAVLPRLQMMPKSHGLTEVSVMLSTGGYTFAWFTNYADTNMIPSLLNRYHSDPEEFLENFFDYKIPSNYRIEEIERTVFKPAKSQAKSQSNKPSFSLSDL